MAGAGVKENGGGVVVGVALTAGVAFFITSGSSFFSLGLAPKSKAGVVGVKEKEGAVLLVVAAFVSGVVVTGVAVGVNEKADGAAVVVSTLGAVGVKEKAEGVVSFGGAICILDRIQ